MKRIVIAAALLLGATLGAHARSVDYYHDLIRPNGHPRSAAIHQRDLNFCYRATGASRYRPDTPAFRKCMLGRGYKWTRVRILPDRPRPPAATPGWHVCHYDCDNPENPESGFVCRDEVFMGIPARRCTR